MLDSFPAGGYGTAAIVCVFAQDANGSFMSSPETYEFLQVVSTTDQREIAERIATALVEDRLAACVQICGPITSIYRWQEKIERAEEWLLVAKTHRELFARVESAIRAHHNYEVPEILATPVVAGHADYLQWLRGELARVEPQMG
jgi:periplasmic divalent cation tolerance protein